MCRACLLLQSIKKKRKREKKIPAAYPESDFDIPVSIHISSFIIFKNGVK